ncbi:MAG: formylglycine-generating enzyme family protein, partial [Planctomycetes bacterium]|nr:formylglycine-generating enzyme family protein [Planctomycetota bacterium]
MAIEVPRDPECIPFDLSLLREVAADTVPWGLYRFSGEEMDWDPASLSRTRVDDAFLLAATETTHDQYYAFLLARARKSGQRTPERFYPNSWKRSTGSLEVRRIYEMGMGNHPVTEVDFAAALEFCAYVWEEFYGSDPDTVVDLPTAQEFVLAGRRGRLELNFPWGTRLNDPEAKVVLGGSPLAVRNPAVGEYAGLFALVGNVAEWVHLGRDPAAAGWSYRDVGYRAAWEEGWTWDMRTPFSENGFELLRTGPAQGHVGFRVAVRRAPTEPTFLAVSKGSATHVPWENPVLPPPRSNREEVGDAEPPDLPEESVEREAAITFATVTRQVVQDFEISGHEITNRQYLTFLQDIALRGNIGTSEIGELLPGSFTRENPFSRVEPVYAGHYSRPRRVRYLYEAGRENQPVEGVRPAQAQAYAEWLTRRGANARMVRLPTVGEYLRAGRGEGTSPSPPGLG